MNFAKFIGVGLVLALTGVVVAEPPRKPQTPIEEVRGQIKELTDKVAALEKRIADLEKEKADTTAAADEREAKAAGKPVEKLYEVWSTPHDGDNIIAVKVKAASPAEALAKVRAARYRQPPAWDDQRFNEKGEKIYPTVTVAGDADSKKWHAYWTAHGQTP